MSGLLTKILSLPIHFPLVRGMISYALIWPTCSVVQEYLENGTTLENANWGRAARFGVFGTFFMAPVFYGWLKYSNMFFTKKDLITAITRAVVEQVSYSPLAMAYFFFGMSLLEGKPYKVCINEVREKFWPTYKVGVIFWPTAQTLNFYFISEKNRIIFVSAASFVWTVYLAHVKAKKQKSDGSLPNADMQGITMRNVNESDKRIPIVVEIHSDKNEQGLNIEVHGDDEIGKNTMLVVERGPESLEKKPELVSDGHERKVSPRSVEERRSEPSTEKREHRNIPVKNNSDPGVGMGKKTI